jgi:predicted transcriptional regulator of viral defense system
MKKMIDIFNNQGGYARMKELKAASVHTREIQRLIQDGVIEKIKPGLYKLVDLPETDGVPTSFVDICQAIPSAIICLLSALDYYKLTTFVPSQVYAAVPNSFKPPKIEYPPVNYFYFRERFYELGIETIKTSISAVRIYNREKTICDVFRYRRKLGEDIALEGLGNYINSKEANIRLLNDYAEKCQVKTIIAPYLKALLAQ